MMELGDLVVDEADGCNRESLSNSTVSFVKDLLSIYPAHIEQLRRSLIVEGFENVGFFQIWKHGQIFGYSRRLNGYLEWHVRAFVDGSLESELEPPRTTIHHLIRRPYLYDGLLMQLLQKHRIPFSFGNGQVPR
jgi:hypothetical protein